ncbi:MAG: hypothetical protein M4579_005010 [Chaenotheca gracillima]|nr:MAG: hypothetical protein M4579_005010 [Chaenotheca gracillima]
MYTCKALSFLLSACLLGLPKVFAAQEARFEHDMFWGTSSYYAHGLSDGERTAWLDGMHRDGAKVVRLWINGVSPGTYKGSNLTATIPNLEEEVGVFNDTVLDAIDQVLSELHSRGMKAIISVHDGNAFGQNSCDAYCYKYGGKGVATGTPLSLGTSFYTDKEAIKAFDSRIAHVMKYKSPRFHKSWSQLSEAIMAFDLENEPLIQGIRVLDTAGSSWACGRAKTFKKYIKDSPIAVSTGGIGGSSNIFQDWNWRPFLFQCAEIDLIALHGYDGDWDQWVDNATALATQYNKKVFVEEWGVVPAARANNLAWNFELFQKLGLSWVYWELVPGPIDGCGCSSDRSNAVFEVQLDGPDYDGFKAIAKRTLKAKSRYDFSKYLSF